MLRENLIKIVLVDDHVLLRHALVSLIDSFEGFKIIGTANHGLEFLDQINEDCLPDIVILDISMPVMDGYTTAKILREKYPSIKMMVLTMFDAEIALIRLLQIGVKGFLKKDINQEELKSALIAVYKEGYYYSSITTGKLAMFFHKAHCNNTSIEKSLLSEFEINFMKLVSTDMTYKEIASKMNLTPRAIDSYRDGLFEKLEVKSRVGLAIFAVKIGLVNF